MPTSNVTTMQDIACLPGGVTQPDVTAISTHSCLLDLNVCCSIVARGWPRRSTSALWLSNLPVLLYQLQNATFTKCHLMAKGGLPGNKSATKDIVRSKVEVIHTLKSGVVLSSRRVSYFASAVCGQVQERLQHSWAGMAHGPLQVTNS